MSNEEREALAVALSRTIRVSVAISIAVAVMIGLVANYFQNQAINRRLDEIEQMMHERQPTNTNSVIIGESPREKLHSELTRKLVEDGMRESTGGMLHQAGGSDHH